MATPQKPHIFIQLLILTPFFKKNLIIEYRNSVTLREKFEEDQDELHVRHGLLLSVIRDMKGPYLKPGHEHHDEL